MHMRECSHEDREGSYRFNNNNSLCSYLVILWLYSDVQQQESAWECGLYAITYAYVLRSVRNHCSCFETLFVE